jgi:hypothetical protein
MTGDVVEGVVEHFKSEQAFGAQHRVFRRLV